MHSEPEKYANPVWWLRYRSLRTLAAHLLVFRQQPVLVLSFPRSGSSWVGSILGASANAAYLREPINLAHFDAGAAYTVFHVSRDAPPPAYARSATLAFSGIPAFHAGIVMYPEQWRLRDRWRRTLVVKEVNPLAAPWFKKRFGPKLVLLVRHPAAVATSWYQMHWVDTVNALRNATHALTEGILSPWRDHINACDDFWSAQGALQGASLYIALKVVAAHDDSLIVAYEDLCLNPVANYKTLFELCGLRWDARVATLVSASSSSNARSADAYSTMRDSLRMVDVWRQRIDQHSLRRLRDAFRAFELPWYRDSDDWTLEESASGGVAP